MSDEKALNATRKLGYEPIDENTAKAIKEYLDKQ